MTKEDKKETGKTDDYSLQIEGISCAACVTNVERALKSVEGVEGADVSLGTSEARVRSNNADINEMIRAVEKAGYGASQLDEMGAPLDTADPADPDNAAVAESGSQKPHKLDFKRKFWIAMPLAAIVFVMDMGPMAIPAWHHWVTDHLMIWNVSMMAITAVILFYTGASFFTGAWRAARHRTADMNSLVAIGTGAAFFFSFYAVFFGQEGGLVPPQDVYFETAAIIIALILLGKWMEERARHRSRDAMTGLLEMTPQKAHRLGSTGSTNAADVSEAHDSHTAGETLDSRTAGETHDSHTAGIDTSGNGNYTTIPVKDVTVGDRLLVKAWEQVPVDGKVVSGHPSLDEAMMTGESVPVEKEAGDEVTGGTRNTSITFVMTATRVGADTALARIIRTVREAQSSKPPIQRLVDKVASIFVPIVLVVALITFAIWLWLGSPAQAMVNMVAVLVIACPCALGLATPTGLMVSSGRAAEKGILIKDAVTLEEARKADVVMFDKTGTLTTGVMEVNRVVLVDGAGAGSSENISGNESGNPNSRGAKTDEDRVLALAASVEQQSDHPIAESIVRYARERKLALADATSVETFMGMGVTGAVNGSGVSVSAHTAYDDYNDEQSRFIGEAQDNGETVLLVKLDGKPAGFITVSDQLRPEAKEVVKTLKKMNITTVMVTGDHPRNANVVAERLGIDRVEAGVKPEEKALIVKSYQQKGKRVAMVGDGINDAAALVQADLGMALSGGTDLAMSSSDITLVGGNLEKVVQALELSRGTLRIIRQNLFWAFVYNTLGIPLAALGFLSPMFAALAMAMSSVSVVTNSLRIKKL